MSYLPSKFLMLTYAIFTETINEWNSNCSCLSLVYLTPLILLILSIV